MTNITDKTNGGYTRRPDMADSLDCHELARLRAAHRLNEAARRASAARRLHEKQYGQDAEWSDAGRDPRFRPGWWVLVLPIAALFCLAFAAAVIAWFW